MIQRMIQRKTLATVACAVSMTLLSGCAAIPYDGRDYDSGYYQGVYRPVPNDYYYPESVNDGSGVVRCESIKGRSQECLIYGRARLIRQLSDTPCVEGDTWGQGRNGVWVTRGCRAEFISERGRYRR